MEMDEIRIENLKVYAYHGVFPEENEKGQDFYVNAILYTDTREAGLSDDLTLSTHYGDVCYFITEQIQNTIYQLIETVAEKTAEAVLLAFPLVRTIDLEIRKPQAPIGLPFASVSVKIRRGWKKAFIALGSNLGDREQTIRDAVDKIKKKTTVRKVCVSELFTTTPYGENAKYDFINGVLELETLMSPLQLLHYLQQLEQEAGRERGVHWGPRTLDLDILLYEDVILDTPELTIPHPDIQNRDFVLAPLVQLAPHLYHPLLHVAMEQLLTDLQEKHIV